jgi:hypothetical protein
VELATRNAEESGEPTDVRDGLEIAKAQLERKKQEEAEKERRKAIKAKVKYSTSAICAFNLLDVAPDRKINTPPAPVTLGQAGFLEKNGIKTAGLSKRDASKMMEKIIGRSKQGWCTVKQSKLLDKFGLRFKDVRFKEASKVIDQIANNSWSVPTSVQNEYGKPRTTIERF